MLRLLQDNNTALPFLVLPSSQVSEVVTTGPPATTGSISDSTRRLRLTPMDLPPLRWLCDTDLSSFVQVVTTPEYLRKRFGSLRIQIFISVLYLFFCIFNRISVSQATASPRKLKINQKAGFEIMLDLFQWFIPRLLTVASGLC